MKQSTKKKIFVGMSGGVDSSVSAALLQEQGHDVIGVFIKVWQADFLPCNWREERREAMRAAAHLGIPFLTLDLEKEYKEEVIDYMIHEYGSGRIPNPDIMCNKYVKFGAFLSFAKKNGGSAIATGHYARINQDGNHYKLLAGVDKEKDQSYFLWTLEERLLSNIIFPIGHLLKSEVRVLARKFGLPNAEKKDSQGLCFMGPINMQEFLQHYLQPKKGDVLNLEGNIIGSHDGSILYTIGQRHGFSTIKSTPSDKPFFVIKKDLQSNTITVAHEDPNALEGKHSKIRIKELCLRSTIYNSGAVRIRYRGELFPMKIVATEHECTITLEHPIPGISIGQSAVFYQNDECFGGGVITE